MSDSIEQSLLILIFFVFMVVGMYYLIYRNRQVLPRHAAFLVGVWERKGHTPEGAAWYIRYVLDGRQVSVFADPPLHLQAQYRVAAEVENLVTLELQHVQRDGLLDTAAPPYLQIAVDQRRQQLTIDDHVFKRV